MIKDQTIVVVMPAYNASSTLEKTFSALPSKVVDHVIVVDDASEDNTSEIAARLPGTHCVTHDSNRGYGAIKRLAIARLWSSAPMWW